jgi:hypothetical protein
MFVTKKEGIQSDFFLTEEQPVMKNNLFIGNSNNFSG